MINDNAKIDQELQKLITYQKWRCSNCSKEYKLCKVVISKRNDSLFQKKLVKSCDNINCRNYEKYVCCLCYKDFINARSLTQHLISKQHNKDFICPICGIKFKKQFKNTRIFIQEVYVHCFGHTEQYVLSKKRKMKSSLKKSKKIKTDVNQEMNSFTSLNEPLSNNNLDNLDGSISNNSEILNEMESSNSVLKFEEFKSSQFNLLDTIVNRKEVSEDMSDRIQLFDKKYENNKHIRKIKKPESLKDSGDKLGPFLNKQHLKFFYNHYVKSNMSKEERNLLLKDLHDEYFKDVQDSILRIPIDEEQLKKYEFELPQMKPSSETTKFPYYKISNTLSMIFANKKLCKSMVFQYHDPPEGKMSEFYHTKGFKRIAEKALNEGVFPVILLIYLDHFSIHQKRKSLGGLYFSLMNFHRELIKSRNIFPISIFPKKVNINEDLFPILASELTELNETHLIFNAEFDRYIPIKVFVGLLLADMPQRNKNCSLKSPNCKRPCCNCLIHYNELCASIYSKSNANGIKVKIRNVEDTMDVFRKVKEKKINKKKAHDEYGIDTELNFNPLWDLKRSQGFDIYIQSPVDIFHTEILGLLRTHFEMLKEKFLKKKLWTKLQEEVSKYTLKGKSKLNLEYFGSWRAEEWLRFIAISPFSLEKILCDENLVQYELWIQHLMCLRILLQPALSEKEIDEAEILYNQFRVNFLKVFPNFNRPNFHAILHIFDQAREWGPPTLWWTNQWEQRHKTFKQWVQSSNMKGLKIEGEWRLDWYLLKKDFLRYSVEFYFTNIIDEIEGKKKKNYELQIGDFVVFIENGQKKIGEIFRKESDYVNLRIIEILNDKHPIHKCPKVNSTKNISKLSKSHIISLCFIFNGYLNEYSSFIFNKI